MAAHAHTHTHHPWLISCSEHTGGFQDDTLSRLLTGFENPPVNDSVRLHTSDQSHSSRSLSNVYSEWGFIAVAAGIVSKSSFS